MTYSAHFELDNEKLGKIREELRQAKSVFRDKSILDSCKTDCIIGRQKEASELLSYLDPKPESHIHNFVEVFGRSGSGKSCVADLVCKSISDSVSYRITNLKRASTIFGCASLIAEDLGCDPVSKYVGINKALQEIENRIEFILREESGQYFVLVLDELDAIFNDRRNNPSDFVYKLLTIGDRLRQRGYGLCIVGISNMPLEEQGLEGRVISRIGSNRVFFSAYTQDELFHILKQVSKRAFSIRIEDPVLMYCAQLCRDDHGDARQALDVLRSAGESCTETISESDIDRAAKKVHEDTFLNVILHSGFHHKIAFASLARASFLTGRKWHSTMDTYRQYLMLNGKKNKPQISYRRFSDILRELEQSGICASKTGSHGRYGYNTEFILTVPEETVKFLSEALWEEWVEVKGCKFRTKNGYYAVSGAGPAAKWFDVKQWEKYLGLEYFFDPKPQKQAS